MGLAWRALATHGKVHPPGEAKPASCLLSKKTIPSSCAQRTQLSDNVGFMQAWPFLVAVAKHKASALHGLRAYAETRRLNPGKGESMSLAPCVPLMWRHQAIDSKPVIWHEFCGRPVGRGSGCGGRSPSREGLWRCTGCPTIAAP